MKHKSRYAIVTVDTEALPKRATDDHVRRLMWGEHENGTAGIREICAIGDEVGAKLVFFVDGCGAYTRLDEVADVIRWLDHAGHDVQLHLHPDYLPKNFWTRRGFSYRSRFLNQYELDRASLAIHCFCNFFSDITGKPVRAFRAGSFRWNADTLRALQEVGISLSFNNSMAALHDGQCVYSEPTNLPYRWSNGVIEVPITEHKFFPVFGKEWWGRFQFPVWSRVGNPLWRVLKPFTREPDGSFLVLLLHSWSLLYWDAKGHAVYRNDRRIEGLHKLVRKLAKDYDIITTAEFLDLHASGKITPTHTTDISLAEMQVPVPRKKTGRENFVNPDLAKSG